MEFKLLLTLLFAIFFVGCKSYEEVNNLKLYDFEDYINKEIKVYEVKEWLYPILDSVIMKTEEVLACQKFENEITFSFEIDFNGSMNSVDLIIILLIMHYGLMLYFIIRNINSIAGELF